MTETTSKTFHAEFQTFDDPAEMSEPAPRLTALRSELARRGLDGFVVPHADRHQNEYLPPSEERLAWLSGFTGSAGTAVILAERAVLFVDGRYTLQARDQTDPELFAIEHLVETPPSDWVEANLAAGNKLGFDPWLHTAEGAEQLAKACSTIGAILVATEPNPIDATRRHPTARSCRTIWNSPANPWRRSSTAFAPRSGSSTPMPSSSPIRTRSPGHSIFAAQMPPTRRCRSPSRSSWQTARGFTSTRAS